MPSHQHHLSIIEAVETLSNIADLEFDRDIAIVQKHELVLLRERVSYRTVDWLHEKGSPATIHSVREVYRLILHFLVHFYKNEYHTISDQNTIEGIKSVMDLVDEAAKKLDKYNNLFHPERGHKSSVTEFEEYKELQEFYHKKMKKKTGERSLDKWVMSLSSLKGNKHLIFPFKTATAHLPIHIANTKRVFVDLDSVKKDISYELFYMRKQDGSRFFSKRLLRNIKLVSDFEKYFGVRVRHDPVENMIEWYDKIAHSSAKSIIKGMASQLDHFLKEIRLVKNNEVVTALNKTLMALMFSSQSVNLKHHHPMKCCAEYFNDFLHFLREALQTKTYQKWVLHTPVKSNNVAYDLLDLTQTLCRQIYTHMHGWEELNPLIAKFIKEGRQILTKEHLDRHQDSTTLWHRLSDDYAGMTKLLKYHPNGPLRKLLHDLESNGIHAYDPLFQQNLPHQVFELYCNDERIPCIRMPSPVVQAIIHKAVVLEEFKAFIRSYGTSSSPKVHLTINLQNRTSWIDFARCEATEELQYQAGMINELSVATLAVDTDFYLQITPYHTSNQADTFLEQFKDHLEGEHSGFYFPKTISKKDISHFVEGALKAIHHIFFGDKNSLTREQRLNFIQIFYLFFELKLIDLVQPSTFSLVCKDSVDTALASCVGIYLLLKLINSQELTEDDWTRLDLMLYGPSLLLRERVMLGGVFNRLLGAIKTIESARDEKGAEAIQAAFAGLYQTPILSSALK